MNKSATITQSDSYQHLGIALLSIFHLVGLIGILSGQIPWIVSLTPVNLLLATITMLYFHQEWNNAAIIFVLICYLIGFMFEVIGVNTGVIFGPYSYGPVLGWKIWETPLIIGFNWLILIYGSSSLVNMVLKKASKIVKALAAALLMVGLDVIIEPVAIDLNFWHWEAVNIPLQNYLAWFLISLALTISFQYLIGTTRNKVGAGLFIIQILFFTILFLFKV